MINLPVDLPLILNNARKFLQEGKAAEALAEIEWAIQVINDDMREYDQQEEIEFGSQE